MESFKLSSSGDGDKNPKTQTEKNIIVVSCIIIFYLFYVVMTSNTDNSTPQPKVVSQVANTVAIQKELDEYKDGRWSFVDVTEISNYLLVRITVKRDTPVNNVATNSYCNIVKSLLTQYAPSHVKTAQVEIKQFGDIVKRCTY